jgi:hypothetical protein
MPHAYGAAVLAQRTVAFASLIAFEPMGDGQCHRVRASSVRHARQPGIRIDLEGDGDQRQYKNDNNGSHGPVCRGRIRPNRSNKRQKRKFHFGISAPFVAHRLNDAVDEGDRRV